MLLVFQISLPPSAGGWTTRQFMHVCVCLFWNCGLSALYGDTTEMSSGVLGRLLLYANNDSFSSPENENWQTNGSGGILSGNNRTICEKPHKIG